MEFEWDPKKARSNIRKRGVSFEEAATVFSDPLAAYYEDSDHSVRERRYLVIGTSTKQRLIHIAFSDQRGRIRIIQAREPTKNERSQYEEETR